jgi:hypothetical protein
VCKIILEHLWLSEWIWSQFGIFSGYFFSWERKIKFLRRL